jgi:hypothetical protein
LQKLFADSAYQGPLFKFRSCQDPSLPLLAALAD